ncbi:hypothetical protein GCK72_020797 [Caenorhabditis remanei]|uniref:F-box domain-containing protein n=1 Tax=Caenorhabditis remanei TaxID=31234 RepID=A0A6A5GG91_CAERE|nr:hypothetical protein GCK72_020797 [Caenorhabditis remanei]KAF1754237.1 hypothetical protein GCK72_020797 [Caenorhabditis remanei]
MRNVSDQTSVMDEIVKLEQWKQIRKFMSAGFFVTESLNHFAHLSSLVTLMETVKTDELLSLKERFVASSTRLYFDFKYNKFVDGQRLVEVFGPLMNGKREWEFDAADGLGKVKISVWVPNKSIKIEHMINLLDLPDLAMSNVLGYLDLNAILTLRKVNRGLRAFVDEEKPDFKIKILSIWLEPDNVSLRFFIDEKNPIRIEYWKKGDTTSVSWRRTQIVNLDIMKACANDLEIILKNQKSISKEIGVSFNIPEFQRRADANEYKALLIQRTEPFLADLKRILGSRNHKIQTRLLRMDVIDQFQMMAVLPYLCPETLRVMSLRSSGHVPGHTLKMDEIVKLEQWKRIQKFMSQGFYITESLNHFAHLSSLGHALMKTVKTDELLLLKEIVIASSTPKYFHFNYCEFVDEERLVEVFGPPMNGEKEWQFDAADGRGKVKFNVWHNGGMANLLDLPDLVMSYLLGYLDFNALLTLRKVNRALREFVDEKKPDFKIKTLYILLRPNKVRVSFYFDENDPIRVEYYGKVGDPTSVSCRRRKIVNIDVMKACTNDLEIILKNQKSISKEIGVFFYLQHYKKKSWNDEYDARLKQRTEPFLADFKRILGSRNHKIQTKLLRMDVIDQCQVMAVFPCLCPKTLRDMTLRVLRKVPGQTLEMDQIVKLEQWKRIQRFLSEGFRITEPLHYFAHLSSLNTYMETVSTDELFMLKERFVASSTPLCFNLKFEWFLNGERLEEVFGRLLTREVAWEFDAADGQGKVKIIASGCESIRIEHVRSVL